VLLTNRVRALRGTGATAEALAEALAVVFVWNTYCAECDSIFTIRRLNAGTGENAVGTAAAVGQDVLAEGSSPAGRPSEQERADEQAE